MGMMCPAFANVQAQCTTHVHDWDYREFFNLNSTEVDNYVSLAQSQTQYYAFGANRLTITHNYTDFSDIRGDVTIHTGEAGSFGSGADVQMVGNGIVTFTWDNPVTNVQFSIYDIDRSQDVAFSALNGATPLNINLSTISGTILTISNNNGTNPFVNSTSTMLCNSSTNGTVNVSVAGPVTSITITVTGTTTDLSGGCSSAEDGSYFISDITACSPGSFPDDYYVISRPFTGMPGYVLTVCGNAFYYVDPATGNAKHLFTDASNSNMNSVAYDPYGGFVYYTYSLSGPSNGVNPNEKALRRYDMAMDTFGVVIQNAGTMGLPIMGQGVESGAAAFYDGHLYWGIEGNSHADVETIIYRIEMDGNNVPVGYSQVYAQEVRTTSSSSRLHDWADFGITNGILYDFDGGVANSSSGANCDYYQMNLMTGAVSRFTPTYNFSDNPRIKVPRQTAIDWLNNVWNIGPYAVTGSTQGQISLYNGNNDLGTPVTITHNSVALTGSWGDAGEAFRPYCDFGDAPLSYEGADPTLSPAVHEQDSNIRLGAGWSREWLKRGSAGTDDNFDDGLAFVPIFSPGFANYLIQVSVFNNTGDSANVCAWVDFNDNGIFDADEGRSQMIGSSASQQNIFLYWNDPVPTTLVNGDITYMRLRVARKASGMTLSNPTGYYDNGETEDYRVIVDNYPLPVQLVSFDAQAVNNQYVQLKWKTASETNMIGYDVERSRTGNDWEFVGFVAANASQTDNEYTLNDNNPYKGLSKYRLKVKHAGNQEKFSEIRTVTIRDRQALISLAPNPARNTSNLTIESGSVANAQISILGMQGNELSKQKVNLIAGNNTVILRLDESWPAGSYMVRIMIDEEVINKKLIIAR